MNFKLKYAGLEFRVLHHHIIQERTTDFTVIKRMNLFYMTGKVM